MQLNYNIFSLYRQPMFLMKILCSTRIVTYEIIGVCDANLMLLLEVFDLGVGSLGHQTHGELDEVDVVAHGAHDLAKQRAHRTQIVVLRVSQQVLEDAG